MMKKGSGGDAARSLCNSYRENRGNREYRQRMDDMLLCAGMYSRYPSMSALDPKFSEVTCQT